MPSVSIRKLILSKSVLFPTRTSSIFNPTFKIGLKMESTTITPTSSPCLDLSSDDTHPYPFSTQISISNFACLSVKFAITKSLLTTSALKDSLMSFPKTFFSPLTDNVNLIGSS